MPVPVVSRLAGHFSGVMAGKARRTKESRGRGENGYQRSQFPKTYSSVNVCAHLTPISPTSLMRHTTTSKISYNEWVSTVPCWASCLLVAIMLPTSAPPGGVHSVTTITGTKLDCHHILHHHEAMEINSPENIPRGRNTAGPS